MANQIEKLDGITLANIAKLDGRTDANIQALNGREFTGFTPVSPNAFTITNYEVDDGRVWAPVLGWDPDTNTLVAVWGDDDNSDYPTYRLGKLSANTGNTTITWQSAVVISTAGDNYAADLAYDTGNDVMGIVFLESGAGGTNRYRIAFGQITNSGATPSMSIGTSEIIHDTSSGNYNQGDTSQCLAYWPDMGAMVTMLEYGDDDNDANFFKAFKYNPSDGGVITSGNNELMFGDTNQEFMQLVYDASINRLVVFYLNVISSTSYIYGNILDFDSSSTNGLTLQLEFSEPGTQLFAGTVASGYDAGAWAAYNTSANIHHVLFSETADSTKKIRNVKISGSDGSFTMDPHTTYELEVPSAQTQYTTIWYNEHRNMMGLMGTSVKQTAGDYVQASGYKFTEDTGTEANSTFTLNSSAAQLKISSHDLFYGRYLGMRHTESGSDMHTGNMGFIMSFYGGDRANEGVIIGFDTGEIQ